jgi:hypothetical protein
MPIGPDQVDRAVAGDRLSKVRGWINKLASPRTDITVRG